MTIRHQQTTYCYCCKCDKEVVVSEDSVSEGSDPNMGHPTVFLKVDPETYSWKKGIINGEIVWICPEHEVKTSIVIDGEPFS